MRQGAGQEKGAGGASWERSGLREPRERAMMELAVTVRGVRRARLLVALATFAFTLGVALVCAGSVLASCPEQFGPESFCISSLQSSPFEDEAETVLATQAGSHPYALTTNIEFNHELISEEEFVYGKKEIHSGEIRQEVHIYGDPRDVVANLPRGLVVDPAATPIRCSEAELLGSLEGHTCPLASSVGVLTPRVDSNHTFTTKGLATPVYNMVPPPSAPAELGVNIAGLGLVLHIVGRVRTNGDYGLTGEVSGIGQGHLIFGSTLTLWGDPSATSHDPWRGECAHNKSHKQIEEIGFTTCPVEPTNTPFLTMPTSCPGTPLESTGSADSWQEPGQFAFSAPTFSPAVTECSSLGFTPSIEVQPETTASDSPTGLHVDLHIPQSEDLATLAEANLKDAVVTLPEDMVINPSRADGLQGCSPTQVDLHGAGPANCPDASKVGSVEVDTPLLERSLPGSVYIASQGENPFNSLLAIYVVVEGQGVIVKLAGHVVLDPVTGRLQTTFEENPQLPFEDFKLHFFGGPRAPLTTPPTCGSKSADTVLTPWSGTIPAHLIGEPGNSFTVASGPNSTACPNTVGEEPNHPGFVAGTLTSSAGSYSPFVLKLTRDNGSQTLKGLNVLMPPGLTGKLAGVALCSQAQIETAEHSPGKIEQSTPSCPVTSQVGTVNVGAGSGAPFYAQGHAYLAGPYKGAPFSLAIVTPAVAGPFDLGTVVVRSALYIDPHTAQVTVNSDPLPTILQGIPLDIRSIAVTIDRPQFTLNPTSCEPMTISATAIAQSSEAALTTPFQATSCGNLPFKPSLTASTTGRTSKASGASFAVRVTQNPGEANIHKVSLTLPLALPARLTTLQKACTEAQFNTNPAGCPEGSNIGTATAHTPLLNSPVTGPAYLVSHGGAAFPDVEFILQGEGVEIVLDGKTDIKKGITYSKFETVPDAPITNFETILPQGPHSALAANKNLCATKIVTVKKRATIHHHGHTTHVLRTTRKQVPVPLTMPTTITAQNGAVLTQNTRIAVTGCPKKTKPAHKTHKPHKKR
jgi:hypothetical protein